ncbi:MAG: DUF418 domain-containing protein [Pseudonocardia sp.]
MPGTEPTRSRTATPLSARAPWPDVARGAMLLLIAVANVHGFLYDRPFGLRSYPLPQDTADRVVTFTQMLLVDGRVYPLFGLLVGYGLVRLARRAERDGPVAAAGLVARRGAALLLIGALHGILLFSGDIVGAYGLLAVVLAVPIAVRAGFVLGYATVTGLLLAAVLGAGSGLPRPPGSVPFPSRAEPDVLTALWLRTGEWLSTGLFGQAIAVLAAVAAGAWWAERMDTAAGDRALLWRVAGTGVAVGVVGGLPLALMTAGWWTAPGTGIAVAAGVAHTLGGFAAAVGYLALAMLVATRAGRTVAALRACGQRSLTCYLTQSVVFVTLLAPFAGGLGATIGLPAASALAAGVWLATVLASVAAGRAGLRGPAEALLRRLTYGRAPGPAS